MNTKHTPFLDIEPAAVARPPSMSCRAWLLYLALVLGLGAPPRGVARPAPEWLWSDPEVNLLPDITQNHTNGQVDIAGRNL